MITSAIIEPRRGDSQVDRSGYNWRTPIRGDRNREILAASIHRIVIRRFGARSTFSGNQDVFIVMFDMA